MNERIEQLRREIANMQTQEDRLRTAKEVLAEMPPGEARDASLADLEGQHVACLQAIADLRERETRVADGLPEIEE